MSVTTDTQRLTEARHDTRRDNDKAASKPGYVQVTGHFCRSWQVLGSNQRRLSRRFYRPPPSAHDLPRLGGVAGYAHTFCMIKEAGLRRGWATSLLSAGKGD